MSIFGAKKAASVQPDFSGLALQTSSSAMPIPIVYGVTRVAPNVIWFAGVYASPERKGGGLFGKGGGGQVTGYDYSCWVMFAVGEGPVRAIGSIWNGQGNYPYGAFYLSLIPGTTPQDAWAPALASYPKQALNYPGTAYMASSYFDMGSDATFSSVSFEVYGLLQAETQTVNLYDADPAVVIQDFLTSSQYGVGFPPASIDATSLLGRPGDGSLRSYCKAVGLAFSPALTEQETANAILTRWLQLINCAAVWSGGELKFVPYGDLAVPATVNPASAAYTITAPPWSGEGTQPPPTVQVVPAARFGADAGVVRQSNGVALTLVEGAPGPGQYAEADGLYTFSVADAGAVVTIGFTAAPAGAFSPNTTPIYDLTDDDFVAEDGQDPVQVARADPYALPNVQRLEILDRWNAYAATPVEARDQNAVEQFGLTVGPTITAHEFCDGNLALVSAQLILQRGLYVRNTYGFKLSWEHCLLEPMDIVALSDPVLGLAATPVRITSIEEDGDGNLAVTAEEFPTQAATAVPYAPATKNNSASTLGAAAVPAPVNPPIIFEPPPALTSGTPQVWAAVSGGTGGQADPNWGGAAVHLSLDGTTFSQIGTVGAPARQGVLTAALPAFDGGDPANGNCDTADTLAVDLGESAGTLATVAAGDAADAVTLCFADGELLAFGTATLTAANAYALTTLFRGLYGSKPSAHAAGTAFARLDDAVFRYTLPLACLGRTLTLKFQSFNIRGGAAQDLANCAAYSFVPKGSGYLGPTATALLAGQSFDEGLASTTATGTDDYGLASDPYATAVDEGLASDGFFSLALAAGGTGAASPAAARANLGAASAGANADITSLTQLAGLGINTAVDTSVNLFAMKSANALFDNTGGGVQIAVNKAGAAATAAHLFETGYSGRAQAGLLGSDRYRVSVSATGSGFAQALDVDPATGHVGLAGFTADANNALGVLGTACLFAAAVDSMRFAFSKVAAANDATLSFQTNFSTRALLGTTGSDQFQLKVSPDGSTFRQVFVADQTTGNLAFKALIGTASYAVATLPTAAFNGALAFATNGRKPSEAAGAGTGVIVAYSNGAWRRMSDDTVVAS